MRVRNKGVVLNWDFKIFPPRWETEGQCEITQALARPWMLKRFARQSEELVSTALQFLSSC